MTPEEMLAGRTLEDARRLAVCTFDYRDIAGDDRRFVKERALAIRDTAKKTVRAIAMMGQWLSEAKERIPHGLWEFWLDTEFGWSPQTARRFIHVLEMVKSNNLVDLNFDMSALYLIAAPKTPEAVRKAAIARAAGGERMNHAKIVALIEECKKEYARRTATVTKVLSETIEECRRDGAVAITNDDAHAQGCVAVKLVLTFWQSIEVLRHPSLPFDQAAGIALAEHTSKAGYHIWKEIATFDRDGMDWCDCASLALANLTKIAETIEPCKDADCPCRAGRG